MVAEHLSHLPDGKRSELERVVRILFEEFDDAIKTKLSQKARRGRILKLILFGSYARGDWVEDRKSGYLSDYDLLVIVNYDHFAEGYDAWEKAADRFLEHLTITHQIMTPVNFIVHTIADVNDQLRRGRPFFLDLARDGIILYETPGHPLAAPSNPEPGQALAEAQRNFEQWFPSADAFKAAGQFLMERGNLSEAAFQLHQTAERLYHCVLLVLALYSPKSHRLSFLRSQAERLAPQLIAVWPRDTKFAKRSFNRLDRAYVDARYSAAYQITNEELIWLFGRIEELQEAVSEVCSLHLQNLARA